MQKIFSLPLNPKLTQSQFDQYCIFLARYKDYIFDIYFTSRIAPFNQDAMGDVFVLHEESSIQCIESALYIQNKLGITVSATFNNINVISDQKNLDIFIKNFKPLYELGIRSATIPHTQWLLTGKIQKEFPELYIKNTILREVSRANEVYELAVSGFNYINLDRDLMRNRDELLKIKKVKSIFPDLKISILANEGCKGNCPIMPEHYQYNCSRTKDQPQYFNSSIARISCQKWDIEDPAIHLKTANLPPWKEDWDEFLTIGVDTFKLHGRENIEKLSESMRIIERFATNQPILIDNFEGYIKFNNLEENPINSWRTIIKNCKFDCWDCNFCDKLYDKKSGAKYPEIVTKLTDIIAFHDNIDLQQTNITGLTSYRVRKLLYNIGLISNHYLEIGCYLGATASAVLDSDIKTAHFVDAWKEDIQPCSGSIIPDNDKNTFIANIKQHKKHTDIKIFDCDLFDANTTQIQDIDFFFYDGPHDEFTTSRAIQYYSNCFSKYCIMIFDDANWEGVVSGAQKGINSCGLTIIYEKILLNEQESEDQWWNGLYIVVTKKNK